jgi:hypothetical protein
MRQLIAVVLVVLGCLAVNPCNAQTTDFNAQVVEKVLVMVKAEMPETIHIIYHESQKEFLGLLENERYKDCIEHSNPFDPTARAYCLEVSRIRKSFLHGLTLLKENDETKLVIHVYRSPSGVPIQTVVHETLHVWLHFQSEPDGFLNSEPVVRLLTEQVLTSDEFKAWLDKKEKNK